MTARHSMGRAALAFLVLAAATAGAQAPAPPPPAEPRPPIIDPARELKGKALVEALRKGGYVLFMRHAETGTVSPKNECDPSAITPLGAEQAKKVGASMRFLKIPVGEVYSSELCRARETANLLGLGSVQVTRDLNPVESRPTFDVHELRYKRWATVPPAGANTFLVSHVHGGSRKEQWVHIEIAEVAVYQPDGNGGTQPVARIPLESWAELIRADRM
jgi:broad specificity phosphatase PhoE